MRRGVEVGRRRSVARVLNSAGGPQASISSTSLQLCPPGLASSVRREGSAHKKEGQPAKAAPVVSETVLEKLAAKKLLCQPGTKKANTRQTEGYGLGNGLYGYAAIRDADRTGHVIAGLRTEAKAGRRNCR